MSEVVVAIFIYVESNHYFIRVIKSSSRNYTGAGVFVVVVVSQASATFDVYSPSAQSVKMLL